MSEADVSKGQESMEPKQRNTTLIIVVVVVVLLLCCCITAAAAWFFGDSVVEMISSVLPTATLAM